MTILPRWFQIGFLALAGIGIAYVFIMYAALASDIEDVSGLEQSAIGVITLSPSKGRSLEISTDAWNAIREELKRSGRVFFTGWKGETWTYFCALEVQANGSDLAYLIELKTRPSLDGDVIFALERGTESSQWVYGSYEGNALLDHLQRSFPNSCQP